MENKDKDYAQMTVAWLESIALNNSDFDDYVKVVLDIVDRAKCGLATYFRDAREKSEK